MTSISDTARGHLARSLPLLQMHREALVAAIEASFAAAAERDEGFGRPGLAAAMLVDLLIEQGRRLADGAAAGDLGRAAGEHRAAGLTGRHYSRFGDALIPSLNDVLGPNLPRQVAAAWCDAFWAAIAAMRPQPEPVSG